MNTSRIVRWLAPFLAWSALAAAQTPPPGGCLPASFPSQAPPFNEVLTPAYYFPSQPATAQRPAFPVAITVWRAPCPTGSSASLWVRMTLNPSYGTTYLARPLIIVEQDGVPIGHFGNPYATIPGVGRNFSWDPTFFDLGNISAGSPIINNLVSRVPFDSDRAFTLRARHTSAFPPGLSWPADAADLRYEVPARGAPGNVATLLNDIPGLWWNPAQSGSGLILDRNERGVMFATWLTYDDTGKSTWFVMLSGQETEPGVIAGPVHAVRGQPFNRPDLETTIAGEIVGQFRFSFKNADAGEFRYTVNGRSGTAPIERLVIRNAVGEVCGPYMRGALEVIGIPGWAANVEGNGGYGSCGTHATLITYDEAGKPMWVFGGLLPNVQQINGAPSSALYGALYRPSGTPYGLPWDASRFQPGAPVGFWDSSDPGVRNPPPLNRVTVEINGAQRVLGFRRFTFEY